MKKTILTAVLVLIASGTASYAHQPRIAYDRRHPFNDPVIVNDPQISRVYYGELTGEADYYRIQSMVPFELYVSLLVPDLAGARTDTGVAIIQGQRTLIMLKGVRWSRFFEPFGRDWYLQGPQYLQVMDAGTYALKVYNTDNRGKYCLAVGRIESFPPGVLFRAVKTMAMVKQRFFGKPASTAYLNPLSGIMVVYILAGAGLVWAFFVVIKRLAVHKKRHGA